MFPSKKINGDPKKSDHFYQDYVQITDTLDRREKKTTNQQKTKRERRKNSNCKNKIEDKKKGRARSNESK